MTFVVSDMIICGSAKQDLVIRKKNRNPALLPLEP